MTGRLISSTDLAGWGRMRTTLDFQNSVLGAAARPILRRQHEVKLRELANEAKWRAPIKTRHLRRSIEPDPVQTIGLFRLKGGVTAHARYARYVHEGTRPHVIRARRASALHFYWEKMGREVWFRSVNHPGTRAVPFLTRATRRVFR